MSQLFKSKKLKIALVHDDLVQWGGAERVLHFLSDLLPEAPIYTSVYDTNHKLLKQFYGNKDVRTSFLQSIPGWRKLYKALFPLYPLAFETFNLSEFDLIISHTTRFANSIITQPHQQHICYCHTPPRFLWRYSQERFPKILEPIFSALRQYDRITSNRVDHWIAGSHNAKQRLQQNYNVDSLVLQPFVDELSQPIKAFEGGYYLIMARLNPYKNVDIAVKTFIRNGKSLKVIGVGPQLKELRQLVDQAHAQNIQFLGSVSEQLRQRLLAGSKALLVMAEEDFGMTPLEAQIFGKPVIALKKGGVLETVIPNKTGIFFDQPVIESLTTALALFESKLFRAEDCIENAVQFSKHRFTQEFEQIVRSCTT